MAESVAQKGDVSGDVVESQGVEGQAAPRLKISDEPQCGEVVGSVLSWVEGRLVELDAASFESESFSFDSQALGSLLFDVGVVFEGRQNVSRVSVAYLTLWKTLDLSTPLFAREKVASFISGLFGEGLDISHRELLNSAFMRRGIATACFDVLEEIAVMSGRSHTRMDLAGSLPGFSFREGHPYGVQADTLLCALGRGYLPDGDDSKKTIDRIERRDGFDVGKDRNGRLKAWPKSSSEKPVCVVRKELRKVVTK